MVEYIINQILHLKTFLDGVKVGQILGLNFFPQNTSIWDILLGAGFTTVLVNLFRGLGFIGSDEETYDTGSDDITWVDDD